MVVALHDFRSNVSRSGRCFTEGYYVLGECAKNTEGHQTYTSAQVCNGLLLLTYRYAAYWLERIVDIYSMLRYIVKTRMTRFAARRLTGVVLVLTASLD